VDDQHFGADAMGLAIDAAAIVLLVDDVGTFEKPWSPAPGAAAFRQEQ
jgi:hypothetical protein